MRVARALACGLPGALALLAFACRSSGLYSPETGPRDRLPVEVLERAREARAAFEAGELERAADLVGELRGEHPLHVPLALFEQEVAIARAAERLGSEEAARVEVAAAARAALLDGGGALERLLVARLAPSAEEARRFLEEAGAGDPDSAWVSYAAAWLACRERDFPGARAALERALRDDPGHAPSRRLQATLAAQAGEVDQAIGILSVWLGAASEDPFVAARGLREARVDLAALHVQQGDPEEALELLEAVEFPEPEVHARAELVRAAAHEERGELLRALEAARNAARLDQENLLPLVQEALLAAQPGGGFPDERASWEAVLRRAAERSPATSGRPDTEGAPIDFQGLLMSLQARVRLERLGLANGGRDAP